jgi:hypothetical protein
MGYQDFVGRSTCAKGLVSITDRKRRRKQQDSKWSSRFMASRDPYHNVSNIIVDQERFRMG